MTLNLLARMNKRVGTDWELGRKGSANSSWTKERKGKGEEGSESKKEREEGGRMWTGASIPFSSSKYLI